ncbi:MAG: hypothetical protein DRO00_00060 [Thermoproteota archaeon]|nr:MAG: hypothetical protein DRO00_00060 [Candidatus Korarchaeota archaeon]
MAIIVALGTALRFIPLYYWADGFQIALESRAFEAYKKRTYLEEPPRLTIANFIAIITVILIFSVFFIGWRLWWDPSSLAKTLLGYSS